MNLNQPIVIISAFKKDLGLVDNIDRHSAMRDILEKWNAPYTVVTGVYEGVRELSFVISVPSLTKLIEHAYTVLARDFEQDCFLFSDANRFTSLHFQDFSYKGIGQLQSLPKEVAETLVSYSHDNNGNYWGVL